jgi:hypothetical protein
MNANELRIGNLVYFLVYFRYYEEFDEHKFCNEIIAIDAEDFPHIDEYYIPIPLTEEWLLKFSAKEMEGGYWISVANLKAELHFEVFKYTRTTEIVTTIKSQFSDLILDRIYDVHQLQNLYFALTNEELTYTL